jgi:hypothetical protein
MLPGYPFALKLSLARAENKVLGMGFTVPD